MRVAIPEPFDFALTVERIGALGQDHVNVLEDGGLRRVVAGRVVTARPDGDGCVVEPGSTEAADVFAHVFGARFDLAGFVQRVADHPVLGGLTRGLSGLRPLLVPDPFEMLVTAISAQQISLHAALAVRNRFVERFGERHAAVYAFPQAHHVARSSIDELRDLGFSRSKARFVLEIARAELDAAALGSRADEEVVVSLTELPGVGRWTAEWFLARHLGREDVWPAGDLGLRRACEHFFTAGEPVDETRARRLGEPFSPQRTLACAYLLAGLRQARSTI